MIISETEKDGSRGTGHSITNRITKGIIIRSLTGPKRAIFRPFFVAGGAKTRPAPKLRSAAGGDVLLTCPGPVAGRRGRHGGARGRKDENPHFRYHSSLNQIVQY